MAEAGVKPAMLTLRSGELVTMVTGEPLRRPATSASALERLPAHSEYSLVRREASVAGAAAAMALAANASEAASEAASVVRVIVMAEVSLELAPPYVDEARRISRPAPKVD